VVIPRIPHASRISHTDRMTHGKGTLLLLCGALALGEFLASLVPRASGCWPLFLGVAVLAAFFGHGLSVPGWSFVAVFVLGVALYFGSAAAEIERNRGKPWMRDHVTSRWRAEQPGGTASEIRRDLSRRMVIGLDGRDDTAALGRAILLGERDGLSPQMKRLFVESGTMHVFAISGLHVMAVATVLSVILRILLVPRRFIGLLAVPLLWGYVTVIGLPPSAVRAATMATFLLLAPLFWRRPDELRSWCLTFLAVHLLNPPLVSNVGNALSFAVMLAIVLAGEASAGLAKWKKDLFVTLVAWAVGLPISAHVFGRVTPGSMLANLVLIDAARVSVYAGTVGLMSSYVSETLAAHLNNLTALGVRTMVFFADAVARLPFSNFEIGSWEFVTCIEWYAVLALAAFLFVRMRRRRFAI